MEKYLSFHLMNFILKNKNKKQKRNEKISSVSLNEFLLKWNENEMKMKWKGIK